MNNIKDQMARLAELAEDTTVFLASRTDRLDTLSHYSKAFDTAGCSHVKVGALAIIGINTDVILKEMAARGLVEYTPTPQWLDRQWPKGWRSAG